jgi:hypothetical protein
VDAISIDSKSEKDELVAVECTGRSSCVSPAARIFGIEKTARSSGVGAHAASLSSTRKAYGRGGFTWQGVHVTSGTPE